jgi:hypothetical protein
MPAPATKNNVSGSDELMMPNALGNRRAVVTLAK